MNASLQVLPQLDAELAQAIDSACARIAPQWPLDSLIAVNPFWGQVDTPIATLAARLGAHTGARLLAPVSVYRDAWREGRISADDLAVACAAQGVAFSAQALLDALDVAEGAPAPSLPLLCDCLDARAEGRRGLCWRAFITQALSQFCASYFDAGQAEWHTGRRAGLFAAWRRHAREDHSARLLMARQGLAEKLRGLPVTPRDALKHMLVTLKPVGVDTADFLHAHLAALNGWAAWCAWLRWQARLEGRDDHAIEDLLVMRLAWEWLLDDGERGDGSPWAALQAAWQAADETCAAWARAQQPLWLWQRALEHAYQRPLIAALARPASRAEARPAPWAQAVFCIDVRSEPLRRALESLDSGIATHGFAGFFGLPVALKPLGTLARRAQLPGLLAPRFELHEHGQDAAHTKSLARRRQRRLAAARDAARVMGLPGSSFAGVETFGLGYLFKLLGRALPRFASSADREHPGLTPREAATLVPHLHCDLAARVELAAGALTGMGLTGKLAPLVLLIAHASQSANNPQAAALDCGACCGQSGAVNARALAAALNEPAVREALVARGFALGATHFVAALHNTTTDEVQLFDDAPCDAATAAALQRFAARAVAAGDTVRRGRAPLLGVDARRDDLLAELRGRARDWSETRPEWGLAGNAALIFAPRERTRGLDLGGRSFLHDYDTSQDASGAVLELLLTAPMLVANWINLQYYASTVDPVRYGSGNKVLHNVVGGRVGVFEGNAGDLRIGLAWQSVHDGEKFVHEPLRLAVFVEAETAAIDQVIARHAVVRHLVVNEWLYLHAIEPGGTRIQRRGVDGWSTHASA
ncbi:MAG: YbcC family protein [Gammaproteobacteria bacterium]